MSQDISLSTVTGYGPKDQGSSYGSSSVFSFVLGSTHIPVQLAVEALLPGVKTSNPDANCPYPPNM